MKIEKKPTLVLGASTNPQRYSYLAATRLMEHHHPIVLVGKSGDKVMGHKIETVFPDNVELDTVTMYLNPMNQRQYYDAILKAKPRRIIFNPGAENPELEKLAIENNIAVEEACTLVLLSTGQY